MRREAIIWDDIIWRRSFICQCSTNLFEDSGTYRTIENGKVILRCRGCGKKVAEIGLISAPDENGYLEIDRKKCIWQQSDMVCGGDNSNNDASN